MNKATATTLAACLLAPLAGGALADGVPIIAPGPALTAAAQAAVPSSPSFVRLHPITFDRSAFGAGVVTAVVDGQEHRFAGSIGPVVRGKNPPGLGLDHQDDYQHWIGYEANRQGSLSLTKNVATGAVGGLMFLPPNRSFEIAFPKGQAALVERNLGLAPRPTLIRPDQAASGVRQ